MQAHILKNKTEKQQGIWRKSSIQKDIYTAPHLHFKFTLTRKANKYATSSVGIICPNGYSQDHFNIYEITAKRELRSLSVHRCPRNLYQTPLVNFSCTFSNQFGSWPWWAHPLHASLHASPYHSSRKTGKQILVPLLPWDNPPQVKWYRLLWSSITTHSPALREKLSLASGRTPTCACLKGTAHLQDLTGTRCKI